MVKVKLIININQYYNNNQYYAIIGLTCLSVKCDYLGNLTGYLNKASNNDLIWGTVANISNKIFKCNLNGNWNEIIYGKWSNWSISECFVNYSPSGLRLNIKNCKNLSEDEKESIIFINKEFRLEQIKQNTYKELQRVEKDYSVRKKIGIFGGVLFLVVILGFIAIIVYLDLKVLIGFLKGKKLDTSNFNRKRYSRAKRARLLMEKLRLY